MLAPHRLLDRPCRRAWMAGLYALVSILAVGAHRHEEPYEVPLAQDACTLPGVHFGSHLDSPDLSDSKDSCAACLVRAHQPLAFSVVVVARDRVLSPHIEPPAVFSSAVDFPAISSRGPPSV